MLWMMCRFMFKTKIWLLYKYTLSLSPLDHLGVINYVFYSATKGTYFRYNSNLATYPTYIYNALFEGNIYNHVNQLCNKSVNIGHSGLITHGHIICRSLVVLLYTYGQIIWNNINCLQTFKEHLQINLTDTFAKISCKYKWTFTTTQVVLFPTYAAHALYDTRILWFVLILRSKFYFITNDCTTKRNWWRAKLNWWYDYVHRIAAQIQTWVQLKTDQLHIRTKKKHKEDFKVSLHSSLN